MLRVRSARATYASGLDQHEPDRHGWAGSLLIYCSTFTEYKNSKLLGSTQRAAIAHYDISICSEFVEHNNCQTLQTTIKTAHPTARAVEASHAACIMNFDFFFFQISQPRCIFNFYKFTQYPLQNITDYYNTYSLIPLSWSKGYLLKKTNQRCTTAASLFGWRSRYAHHGR